MTEKLEALDHEIARVASLPHHRARRARLVREAMRIRESVQR